MRKYKELNNLEKLGFMKIMKDDNWHYSLTTSAGVEIPCLSKKIVNTRATIKLDDIWIDDEK